MPGAAVLLFLGRKCKCYCVMLKMTFVRTITEGFVLRKTTTADRDDLSATQVVWITMPVHYFKIAFNLARAVAVHRDLCRSHVFELRARK